MIIPVRVPVVARILQTIMSAIIVELACVKWEWEGNRNLEKIERKRVI